MVLETTRKLVLMANIHSLTLLSLIVNLLSKWSIEDELTCKQVSFANKRGTRLILQGMSLRYNKKSSGSRVEL